MTEYALMISDQFQEIRNYDSKPSNIPHKNITWHDVVRESGLNAFTGLENDKWVIRSALPSLDQIRQNKLNKLAAIRWEKETGGTSFNGIPISTDAVSQTKYIGAVVGAQIDPNVSLKWKMANGEFVTLDAQAIVAIAMTVRGHVQACFDNESSLQNLINAAETKEEIEAIDLTVGWPT